MTAALSATALSVAAPGGGRSEASATREAQASAYLETGERARTGYVEVIGRGRRATRGTSVRASAVRHSASATARAASVDILSGLVRARSVAVAARASGHSTNFSGVVQGLRVRGRDRGSFTSPARLSMGGYGTLAVMGSSGSAITGLQATLTKRYRDHPKGTVVTVAFASARGGGPTAAERRRATERRRARREAARKRREKREALPPLAEPKRRPAPELQALRTARGYAFPVYGKVSFTNDWGAPRQYTGQHEGNDIFAPTGTPILAVTDGRVFRVGTKHVPGNRLWLRSKAGDTYFYAHLSAFADHTRNGLDVKAGDVLGFVGSTGSAEKTPPHLHFQVHPKAGEPTNPYPFLRSWQRRHDVPTAAWLDRHARDPGARPGALVVVRDFLEP